MHCGAFRCIIIGIPDPLATKKAVPRSDFSLHHNYFVAQHRRAPSS
jgi:hypothetical protein